MSVRLLILLLIVVSLNGCASMKEKEKFVKLDDSLNRYAAAIRWARYVDAYDYHVGIDGYRPKLKSEKYEGIRVTTYETIEKTLNAEGTEATVVVNISYYDDNVGTVNKFQHLQTWWYNEETTKWLLDADLPDLK